VASHRQLRIVFFGSLGAYSAAHLDALAKVHRVVGVFTALQSTGARRLVGRMWRALAFPSDRCGIIARRHGVPRWFTDRDATDVAARMLPLDADVVCVAGYPWLLPPGVWQQPRLGALNSHGSLLPRHRGILPLFWIYYHDDKETGVSIHRVNERADAGEIVCQEVYPLPRGFPVERLSAMNTERGSRLLLKALEAVAAGDAGVHQDETKATCARMVMQGTSMVDFSWDVERVWHFLAGLFPRFIEPLHHPDLGRIPYQGVIGYERVSHSISPGSVAPGAGGWHLFCAGGIVHLASAPAFRPMKRLTLAAALEYEKLSGR
jgi:methionyl-tRNA formyltransferase